MQFAEPARLLLGAGHKHLARRGQSARCSQIQQVEMKNSARYGVPRCCCTGVCSSLEQRSVELLEFWEVLVPIGHDVPRTAQQPL